jgi:putative Ca2+/H+ antiporter (TMEM165/GDT1 family)
MDWKVMAAVFASVFLAELGDKTQLVVILSCAISRFVKEAGIVHRLAGAVFIVVGVLMVFGTLS